MSFGMKISRALRFLEIPVKNRASVNFLRNPDLQPIKSVNQTWGFWSNFAYWGVLSFNVGMWIGGSSALTVGLSYSETIGAFIIADLLTILFALANSCPGYDWKVGFTLAQRFVFGIYGSALGIIIRILMSIVYYGSNAWLGGLCVNMILDSWSHHYLHLPNTLSSKVATTTKELIGFIIFPILTAFCYFMKPYHMNYILIWSCIGTFFAMLGMVIYLTKSAHGVGDLFTSTHSTVTGSKKAWAWVYTISYWYGSVSPGCTNQSDFSRFGSSNCAIWTGTIVALLIPATLIPVFGIIGASACEKLYGQTFWMPMDIFDNWLTTNYSAGARAATFFCGFCFVMSQISYTISNCGFASGMDLAGLLPKYVDIKRGAIFAACVSWACLPWNFYNSSSTFLTVMSSFGVVMTPIITVMICDNFLIRKRQYSVTNAFVLKGEYYFTKGVNWRAIVAWVCGMAPGLPGIAWEVNNDYFHNTGIINFFYGDSFFSFLISFFVYWGLCLLFPFKITVKHDDKDYYGAFTDEEARKKGMVPYSEISEEEIRDYTLGECFTSGHEYKPESSDDELPELTKTSSENTKVFEIVHQKDNEKESSTSSEKQIA
ncbi:BFH_HP2_G0050280.mRNA.1.CDS.1 [Saccharomyces cerevisiae]|nr:BFH_HP2_G0050280.mRNA.1.CDS.1 [Saccharomyces cerevisiae]CAI6780976.1 BFH_HP2_G0050280.mRNA.1.CDS.1 [Saccharomyces cerevisiae]CAI6798246.1 BFH_HP1_G0051200.mRNA.1.CDS.1 [Saccharomyces cerevisiae]